MITGAAGGLGRAFAAAFAAEGARLALLDVDGAAVETMAAEFNRTGTPAAAAAADLTDATACDAAVVHLREQVGPVDILINNAGITHVGPFAAAPPGTVKRVLNVNVLGAVHATRACLGDLRSRAGQIITVSSVAGFAPLSGRTAYAASKHALHGFFETLAAELQPDGVAITLACPTFIATGIREMAPAAGASGTSEGRPGASGDTAGRVLTPDVAVARILAGARRERRIVLVGGTARIAWWLRKLAPNLYDRMMRRTIQGRARPAR